MSSLIFLDKNYGFRDGIVLCNPKTQDDICRMAQALKVAREALEKIATSEFGRVDMDPCFTYADVMAKETLEEINKILGENDLPAKPKV